MRLGRIVEVLSRLNGRARLDASVLADIIGDA